MQNRLGQSIGRSAAKATNPGKGGVRLGVGREKRGETEKRIQGRQVGAQTDGGQRQAAGRASRESGRQGFASVSRGGVINAKSDRHDSS
jgi:hypothetical protein